MNPVISLTVKQNNEKTFDDLISEKAETLTEVIESGNLKIISQEKTTVNGNQVYVTNAEGTFSANAETYNVKFKELIIYDTEKIYTLAYSNGVDNFNLAILKYYLPSFPLFIRTKAEMVLMAVIMEVLIRILVNSVTIKALPRTMENRLGYTGTRS